MYFNKILKAFFKFILKTFTVKSASFRATLFKKGGTMDAKDIAFLQDIANKLIFYCAQAEINNEKFEEQAQAMRARFKLETEALKPKEVAMLVNMPGITVSSKRRADGRYQGYITKGGKRYYFYGKSANEVVLKIQAAIDKGFLREKKEPISRVPQTFNAFSQYYFENFRKKKVAERTFVKDMERYRKHILPTFKELPLKSISPGDCQKLLDGLTAQGKGKTCDEIYGLLSVIFKAAIAHNIITHNPLAVVFHVKHERQHGSALTREEEKLLINSLAESPYLPVMVLLLCTGLRPNELSTVQIKPPFIVAVNSKRKNRKVEYKKIPIMRRLAPLLPRLVIPNVELLRDLVRTALPNHKLYDLRTTFYSRCKECGIAQPAIDEYMGHSLGEIGNAYTDISDEFLLREAEKFV